MGESIVRPPKKKEIDVRSPPPALRLATATPPCVRWIASLATGIASSLSRTSLLMSGCQVGQATGTGEATKGKGLGPAKIHRTERRRTRLPPQDSILLVSPAVLEP